MPPHPPKQTLPKTPLFTPYVVIWACLGTLGLGYISLAVTSPETLYQLTPTSSAAFDPANPGTIHLLGRVANEIGEMRTSVGHMKLEVEKLKTDVSGQAEAGKALETRIEALVQRVKAQERPIEANAAASTPAAPQPDSAPPAAIAEKAAPAKPDALPPTKVINADAGAKPADKIVTGSVGATTSVKKDSIDFGPAVVTPAKKPIGLRLGSGNSLEALKINWALLTENNRQQLSALEPRAIANSTPGNPKFDLVAGPVKSKAEAIAICKSLAAQAVPCKVGDFKGDTF